VTSIGLIKLVHNISKVWFDLPCDKRWGRALLIR
jgi:hypothetical protein